VRPVRLDWVRNEIIRMRRQLRTHEREIWMLQRAGVSTASAVCRERDLLRFTVRYTELASTRFKAFWR
jgi:hypothetical protein